MIYNSVAEILEEMSNAQGRLFERLEGLSATQEDFRPSADAWSVAEIVEHVARVEHQVSQIINVMLTKAAAPREGNDADATTAAPPEFKPFSLDEVIERSKREKYQAPEKSQPRGGVPVAESIAKMQTTRETILSWRQRFETADLSSVHYPHPAFGPFDIHQWLVMIGVHADRHLRQIEAVMQTPEFKAL